MMDQFASDGVLILDISCSHASPLVIVHKKEGSIRMEVDYRESISVYQLPYQDMQFQHLAGQLVVLNWIIFTDIINFS